MANPDPIEENLVAGLAAERAKLEQLAAKLSAEETLVQDAGYEILDEIGRESASLVVDMIAGGIRSFLSRPRAPVRSRLTTPTPRAPPVVATPLPVAAVPALMPVAAPVERPAPIPRTEPPTTSGMPNAEFGDHLEDHPLNLNGSPGPRGPKAMRGPIVGGFVPPE